MLVFLTSLFTGYASADEYTCSTADPEVVYDAKTASWAGYPDGDLYDLPWALEVGQSRGTGRR